HEHGWDRRGSFRLAAIHVPPLREPYVELGPAQHRHHHRGSEDGNDALVRTDRLNELEERAKGVRDDLLKANTKPKAADGAWHVVPDRGHRDDESAHPHAISGRKLR